MPCCCRTSHPGTGGARRARHGGAVVAGGPAPCGAGFMWRYSVLEWEPGTWHRGGRDDRRRGGAGAAGGCPVTADADLDLLACARRVSRRTCFPSPGSGMRARSAAGAAMPPSQLPAAGRPPILRPSRPRTGRFRFLVVSRNRHRITLVLVVVIRCRRCRGGRGARPIGTSICSRRVRSRLRVSRVTGARAAGG